MNQELSWLSLIGAIAPMLGLLGTVMGMVGAFGTISIEGGTPKPAKLAGDIQFALITTVEGLVVAVPTLVAYAMFRNRVTRLILETGVAATSLIGRFKNVKITSAMVSAVEAVPAGKPRIAPPTEKPGAQKPSPPPPRGGEKKGAATEEKTAPPAVGQEQKGGPPSPPPAPTPLPPPPPPAS